MSEQDNTPRVMPLAKPKKIKSRKNRVTVGQIISACSQPLSMANPQTAINEFASMGFDWRRAAQVHLAIGMIQPYNEAAVAAFNAAPPDKKDEALQSTMVLKFKPFDVEGLFISGAISGGAMARLDGWFLARPIVNKGDLKIDPPLAEGETHDDEEEEETSS